MIASLILGGPGNDTILRWEEASDCILGGGGDDKIDGNGGKHDVCIGGPGSDTFVKSKCEKANRVTDHRVMLDLLT